MSSETSKAYNNNIKNTANRQSQPTLNSPSTISQPLQHRPSFISDKSKSNRFPSELQAQSRLSHNVTTNRQSNSNTAFVNLRNQISHLRSQFSKLNFKGHPKIGSSSNNYLKNNQVKDQKMNERANRVPTLSVLQCNSQIHLAEKTSIKSQRKQSYEQFNRFHAQGSYIRQQDRCNHNQGVIIQDKKIVAQQPLDKSVSNFSSSRDQVRNTQFSEKQSKNLTKESQQNQLSSATQQKKAQQQYKQHLLQKEKHIQKLKMMLEQANTTLSLQSNQIAKLQAGIAKLENENRLLLNQALSRFQTINQQKEKYQKQLQLAKEMHKLDWDQLKNKYQQTLELLQGKVQQNLEITAKLAKKDAQMLTILQKNRQFQTKLTLFQNYLKISEKNQQKKSQLLHEGEILTQQIKQQYSNNSIHQKYAEAKQQVRTLRSELLIKEAHIKSIYKDIAILDTQLKIIPTLKGQILVSNKFIEELNQTIISLQLQKLNSKFFIYQRI